MPRLRFPIGNPNFSPPDVGPDRAKWMALVTRMAEHEIGAEGARIFEVWNEPDGLFWSGGLSGYLQLYTDTAAAVGGGGASPPRPHRDRRPRAGRVRRRGAELGGRPGRHRRGRPPAARLRLVAPLRRLSGHRPERREPARRPVPDRTAAPEPAVLVQPWFLSTPTPSPPRPRRRAPCSSPIRRCTRSSGVDEWNVDAGEDARHDTAYGAAFVADACLSTRSSPGVDPDGVLYDAQDPVGDPTQNFGMLTPSGVLKPSYDAFALWRRLAGDVVPSVVAASPDAPAGDQVDAAATRARSGVVKTLVVNFAPYDPTGGYGGRDPNPYDQRVIVALSDLAGRYRGARTVLDARHAATVVSVRFVIGARRRRRPHHLHRRRRQRDAAHPHPGLTRTGVSAHPARCPAGTVESKNVAGGDRRVPDDDEIPDARRVGRGAAVLLVVAFHYTTRVRTLDPGVPARGPVRPVGPVRGGAVLP